MGRGTGYGALMEHRVPYLNNTLLTGSVFRCNQESRVGILYSWRVDRDDGTTIRKLGFPDW